VNAPRRASMTAETRAMAADPDLEARWLAYRQEHPGVWLRDAAEALGVTEEELLAIGCGGGVTRLTCSWKALVEMLPALGEVKTMTRNENAVMEKWGRYERVEIVGNIGHVVGKDIDLRLFMHHWRAGYAVCEEGKYGLRRSLQFFDAHGTSIHKIYLEQESTLDAYSEIIEGTRSPDQSSNVAVTPAPPAPFTFKERPDAEVDAAGLCAAWDGMQDTHDLFGLLRTFGVTRAQALRIAGPKRAHRVTPSCLAAFLESAAADAMPIMILVGSRGVLQAHTGPVHHIKPMGPWINVLDERFNLHLREDRIAEAWVVKKPTRDGIVTSLELFTVAGETIALFFGKRKPGEVEPEAWRRATGALDEPALPLLSGG
jgi:putative hemin transport protein